jgi:hypothetical protein
MCSNLNADLLDGKHASEFWGGGASTDHALLSTIHSDTLAASAVLGDIIHGNTTPVWARLVGNTTATKKFLVQTGTGLISAVPGWDTIVDGDVPATHSGSAHHAAVTLATAGDTLLGLSGQALDLDTQAANLGFFGPVSGAVAAPTFRSLVNADFPATLNPTFAGIVIADGGTIGLGSGKGLIQFDDETIDTIIFSNCSVGIGAIPTDAILEVLSTSTVDGGIALRSGHTGASAGSAYGIYADVLGASGYQNIGIYSRAINACYFNYSFYGAGGVLYNLGDINTGGVLKIDDVQVVSNRVIDAKADDTINTVVWDATTAGVLTALRDAMITHGLIAASV